MVVARVNSGERCEDLGRTSGRTRRQGGRACDALQCVASRALLPSRRCSSLLLASPPAPASCRREPALSWSASASSRDARAHPRGSRGAAAGHHRHRERVHRRQGDLPRPAGARRARAARARRLETVRFTAANDYFVDIPTSDFRDYDAILAMEADGETLSRREKGPLWLMYPISDHAELRIRSTCAA